MAKLQNYNGRDVYKRQKYACFSGNSVNRRFSWLKKRQPPSPETARTAGRM